MHKVQNRDSDSTSTRNSTSAGDRDSTSNRDEDHASASNRELGIIEKFYIPITS